jgi:hypothetical protein
MAEPAIKQKIRRAIKRAIKLLCASGDFRISEIKDKHYHLIVRMGENGKITVRNIKICLPGDPTPPPVEKEICEVWEINKRGAFNIRIIN